MLHLYRSTRRHANVRRSRYTHESYVTYQLFNVAGSINFLYRMQQAESGVVDVCRKRFSSHPCVGFSCSCILSVCSASEWFRHKSSLTARLVLDFSQTCELSSVLALFIASQHRRRSFPLSFVRRKLRVFNTANSHGTESKFKVCVFSSSERAVNKVKVISSIMSASASDTPAHSCQHPDLTRPASKQ